MAGQRGAGLGHGHTGVFGGQECLADEERRQAGRDADAGHNGTEGRDFGHEQQAPLRGCPNVNLSAPVGYSP